MENAAKALLITGGMLFAIIVLSILVFGYNSITNVKQAQIDEELKQEIEKFNSPFLAFNKKAMYGTDVISIFNLAINNNNKYDVEYGEEYYVDIVFKLTKDSVEDREYTYVLDETTSIYSSTMTKTPKGYGAANLVFEKNKEYGLSTYSEPIKAFLLTAQQNEEIKTIIEENNN